MTPELYGLILRSNPESVVLGGAKTIKPDYLNAARAMTAPVVTGVEVRFTGTVGAVSGGALGRDAAKILDTVRFKDDDDVLNAAGCELRIYEQLHMGERQIDPADISSGATNTTYTYSLWIPFSIPRAKRPIDFAIPVANLLDGGEFTLQFASAVPTGWAAQQSDWTVQLFAHVQDGRRIEAKSRLRLKSEATPAQEFDYQINGYLACAFLTSKLATTGHTTLAGFSTFNSRSLKWPAALQTRTLVNIYRREQTSFATNDEFLLAAPGAIPLLAPYKDQKIGRMPDLKTFHVDMLQAPPASGRIFTASVIDRNPQRIASMFNYRGPGAAGHAVKQLGRVKGAADNYDIGAFNGDLAKKLPYRIATNKG